MARMPLSVYQDLVDLGVIQKDTDLKKSIHKNGLEYPNPKPLEISAGYRKPETLADQIRRVLRSNDFLQRQGYESFDEANDLDFDDDPEPLSEYQTVSMTPDVPPIYQPVTDPPEGKGVGTGVDSGEDLEPKSGE